MQTIEIDRLVAPGDRVLAPDGWPAVSVPGYGPERLCRALSAEDHRVEGGHARTFQRDEPREAVERRGPRRVDADYVHAFHPPCWWLRRLRWDRAGRGAPPAPLSAHGRFLEWAESGAPSPVGRLERLPDRLIGKSLVPYFERP